MGYYNAENGMKVRDFAERWMSGDKAYDSSMPIQMPIEDLWSHREYDWTPQTARMGRGWLYGSEEDQGNVSGPEKWDQMIQSLAKYGWDEREPLHLNVDKKGNAKIGEGNHRLPIAKKLGIKTVPVMVHFVFEDWSSGLPLRSSIGESMLTFKEFIAQRESSAYTRSRDAFERGTGVPVPVSSRSTPSKGAVKAQKKAEKKKDRSHKKKGSKEPVVNTDIDKWLDSVDGLKKDMDSLDKEKSKEKKGDPKPKKKCQPKAKNENRSFKGYYMA